MSLIQKLYDAQENKDLEKINEILSEDYVWVQHSTGKHIPRDEVNKFIMSGEGPKTESQRIIYENDGNRRWSFLCFFWRWFKAGCFGSNIL